MGLGASVDTSTSEVPSKTDNNNTMGNPKVDMVQTSNMHGYENKTEKTAGETPVDGGQGKFADAEEEDSAATSLTGDVQVGGQGKTADNGIICGSESELRKNEDTKNQIENETKISTTKHASKFCRDNENMEENHEICPVERGRVAEQSEILTSQCTSALQANVLGKPGECETETNADGKDESASVDNKQLFDKADESKIVDSNGVSAGTDCPTDPEPVNLKLSNPNVATCAHQTGLETRDQSTAGPVSATQSSPPNTTKEGAGSVHPASPAIVTASGIEAPMLSLETPKSHVTVPNLNNSAVGRNKTEAPELCNSATDSACSKKISPKQAVTIEGEKVPDASTSAKCQVPDNFGTEPSAQPIMSASNDAPDKDICVDVSQRDQTDSMATLKRRNNDPDQAEGCNADSQPVSIEPGTGNYGSKLHEAGFCDRSLVGDKRTQASTTSQSRTEMQYAGSEETGKKKSNLEEETKDVVMASPETTTKHREEPDEKDSKMAFKHQPTGDEDPLCLIEEDTTVTERNRPAQSEKVLGDCSLDEQTVNPDPARAHVSGLTPSTKGDQPVQQVTVKPQGHHPTQGDDDCSKSLQDTSLLGDRVAQQVKGSQLAAGGSMGHTCDNAMTTMSSAVLEDKKTVPRSSVDAANNLQSAESGYSKISITSLNRESAEGMPSRERQTEGAPKQKRIDTRSPVDLDRANSNTIDQDNQPALTEAKLRDGQLLLKPVPTPESTGTRTNTGNELNNQKGSNAAECKAITVGNGMMQNGLDDPDTIEARSTKVNEGQNSATFGLKNDTTPNCDPERERLSNGSNPPQSDELSRNTETAIVQEKPRSLKEIAEQTEPKVRQSQKLLLMRLLGRSDERVIRRAMPISSKIDLRNGQNPGVQSGNEVQDSSSTSLIGLLPSILSNFRDQKQPPNDRFPNGNGDKYVSMSASSLHAWAKAKLGASRAGRRSVEPRDKGDSSRKSKGARTTAFNLEYNECSIAAISAWATHSSGQQKESSSLADSATVPSNFRKCSLCGYFGHYEIECRETTEKSKKTPMLAHETKIISNVVEMRRKQPDDSGGSNTAQSMGSDRPGFTKLTCEFCLSGINKQHLLVCDGCEKVYHLYCVGDAMSRIPKGEWLCENCQELKPGWASDIEIETCEGFVFEQRKRPRFHGNSAPKLLPFAEWQTFVSSISTTHSDAVQTPSEKRSKRMRLNHESVDGITIRAMSTSRSGKSVSDLRSIANVEPCAQREDELVDKTIVSDLVPGAVVAWFPSQGSNSETAHSFLGVVLAVDAKSRKVLVRMLHQRCKSVLAFPGNSKSSLSTGDSEYAFIQDILASATIWHNSDDLHLVAPASTPGALEEFRADILPSRLSTKRRRKNNRIELVHSSREND